MMEKKLHIALIGYGKMGRTIEKLALARNHVINAVIDNEMQWETEGKHLKNCDVAIEFTTPSAAPENIKKCFEYHLPVITGTTGWLNEFPAIESLCKKEKQTLFYASNFSIGVNFFFELNRYLAGMLSDMAGYRPRITETHHMQKLDAPSGTAISLARDIIEARNGLSKWGNADESLPEEALPIKAYRMENVTGTHIVSYESVIDSIEIKHTAHDRSGFAEGALLAAEWVQGKRGVFTMKDLLNI